MEVTKQNITLADELLQQQILNQIPTTVMAVDKNMNIIYINDAGIKILSKNMNEIIGKPCCEIFNSSHCNTEECRMKRVLATGVPYSARNEITINNQIIPIEYYAVPLKNDKDEIIGGLEYVLDITERVQYEERLREQSYTIRQMSTPTIKLWDGVLVLPIVGVVDSMRAQHMMESMLTKIVETYSKVIILDIQGVAAVDTAVANHLIKITKATKLMGCDCILSGISPAVAQTIIHLGVDMDSVKTRSTLSDALEEAFTILKYEVIKK